MKIKSTTYYWLAVILGGVGMGAAMGAEGTAQTTGYISGTLFSVSLVLILAAVLLARLGFAAEDREKAAKRRKRQDQPHPRPQPGVPGESGAWGMMTAKEYVEGKVKSYTRLAERCRLEAEASDDIVVRAGYSARANVWEMCAEEMDNVREMLQEESGEITYA